MCSCQNLCSKASCRRQASGGNMPSNICSVVSTTFVSLYQQYLVLRTFCMFSPWACDSWMVTIHAPLLIGQKGKELSSRTFWFLGRSPSVRAHHPWDTEVPDGTGPCYHRAPSVESCLCFYKVCAIFHFCQPQNLICFNLHVQSCKNCFSHGASISLPR